MKKSKKEILKEQVQNETAESTILNPSYTFDSFVVGPSNQMAYNASLAVSNKPGIQYNPLFIYGELDLGKLTFYKQLEIMLLKREILLFM